MPYYPPGEPGGGGGQGALDLASLMKGAWSADIDYQKNDFAYVPESGLYVAREESHGVDPVVDNSMDSRASISGPSPVPNYHMGRVRQRFTPSGDILLTHVSWPQGNSAAPLRLRIIRASDQVELATTAQIVPGGGGHAFQLATPVALVGGTEYTFQVENADTVSGNVGYSHHSSGVVIAGGSAASMEYQQGGNWTTWSNNFIVMALHAVIGVVWTKVVE